MPTNLVDVEPDPPAIKIGIPAQVVLEDLDDEIALLKFRPAWPLPSVAQVGRYRPSARRIAES